MKQSSSIIFRALRYSLLKSHLFAHHVRYTFDIAVEGILAMTNVLHNCNNGNIDCRLFCLSFIFGFRCLGSECMLNFRVIDMLHENAQLLFHSLALRAAWDKFLGYVIDNHAGYLLGLSQTLDFVVTLGCFVSFIATTIYRLQDDGTDNRGSHM